MTETNTDTREQLQIAVQDFGPIISANIQLRPLTIFVGPSNTGKSWLAILIYSLHKFFSSLTFSNKWIELRHDLENLSEQSIEIIADWWDEIYKKHEDNDDHTNFSIPRHVIDALLYEYSKNSDPIVNEITRCFGISNHRDLIRKNRSSSRVILHNSTPSYSQLQFELLLNQETTSFNAMLPDDITIPTRKDYPRFSIGMQKLMQDELPGMENNKFFGVAMALNFLSSTIVPIIARHLRSKSYYLPADRTGVMHAHSAVVSSLISGASLAGLRPATRTATLSGVLADFLEQLIGIDQGHVPRQRDGKALEAQIESSILGGAIQVERTEALGYPRFTYRPDGWKNALPLTVASSMVSELAPVVLYLRHLVEPDNLLIIEEPESHLHPGMQVKFAREVAALVEKGVKVLITTHSEWVLEEVSNIVQRSRLSDKGGIGERGEGISLQSNQVGVWMFEPKARPKGSMVKEVRADEAGLYSADFDEVAIALHNDWARITDQVGE